ncbi:D-hexose-6-phosphate mutarotase [Cumulibacter manganitolerans]|uniref:D-hexose-6-phosphate mutarotase n=1 Tax=Cumulibacter manganitolerans TaxID=1884992 RepID=UPI0018862CE6|nr:D-hexose-6-phosphate mutarotase [Cumulibacter manganitolerans]
MSVVEVHEAQLLEGRYAVSPHGAQVTSWWSARYGDLLYLSSAARFEAGKAIRGGIPICFPWFAGGPSGDRAPAHGFARLARWREITWDVDEQRSRLRAGYLLDPSAAGRAAPGSDSPFVLRYDLELTPRSGRFTLRIENRSAAPAGCEAALHTYLRVGDATSVALHGLDGATYADKTAGGTRRSQRGPLTLGPEVDRVYDCAGDVTLQDPALARSLLVRAGGASQTVVWNPGETKAAALADVGAGEWRSFVCVEAAAVGEDAIRLGAGQSHELAQEIVPGA